MLRKINLYIGTGKINYIVNMEDITKKQVVVFRVRNSLKHDVFCGNICKQECIQSQNKGTQLVYLNKTKGLREYAVSWPTC